MYYLNKYDYKTGKNNVIGYDSIINIKSQQRLQAYNYTVKMNGEKIKQLYDDLFYTKGNYPNRERQQLCGAFYITNSRHDDNILYVKEYYKDYGYIYNSFYVISHIKEPYAYHRAIIGDVVDATNYAKRRKKKGQTLSSNV